MQPSFRRGASASAGRPVLTRRSERVGRAFAVIGLVGPLFYICLVVVLGLLWSGYDPIRQTQSELGAVEYPYGDLMNVAGFSGLELTILAFAVAYQLLLNRTWVQKLATVLLVLGGLGMVVVGFFPCDAGCVDVTRTSELHSIFSVPGAIGLWMSSSARHTHHCRRQPCSRHLPSGSMDVSVSPGRPCRSGSVYSPWLRDRSSPPR